MQDPFHPPKEQQSTPLREGPHVFLEQEGRARINQIARAARKVPWSIHLLQLAWTAGPVTFIAMQSAHYLGFGTTAPSKNIIFFIAYTIILGLIGLVTRLIYSAIDEQRQQGAQHNLVTVLDRLPDLIFGVRDIWLRSLEPEERRRQAAGLLLRKADLGANFVAQAVEDLTDDTGLAHAVEQIEIFRRASMHSRVQDLVASIRESADAAVANLAPVAPETATILNDRLHGRAPSLKDGVPREPNFIERILGSRDEDEQPLVTLRDVEDMLVLAFELMSGREIPMLTFEYHGRWEVAQATDAMEQARNRYRLAQSMVLDRLDALAMTLSSEDHAATTTRLDPNRLLTYAHDHLADLANRVDYLSWRHKFQPALRDELRQTLTSVASLVNLIQALRQAYSQALRQHANFIRAIDHWGTLLAKQNGNTLFLSAKPKQHGLRIVERSIKLEDTQKLAVADALAHYLKAENIHLQDQQLFHGKPGREHPMDSETARRLATEVASTLEPYVELSKPETQRAINSVNAAYMIGFHTEISAATKTAWGAAKANEVWPDMDKAAERLALTLVKTYGVVLDDTAIDFLHERYGANRDRLHTLASQTETAGSHTPQHPELHPVLDFGPQWRRTVHEARALVATYAYLLG